MASRGQGNRSIEVYTDGACPNNGREGAQAGIGGHFPDNPRMDFSKPAAGRQTNNSAEIQAAAEAIERAKEHGYSGVKVKTDSEFLTKAANEWMGNWKSKGWTKADGGPVKNREDFQRLDRAREGMDVRFEHVRGHQGNPGNEQADKLARQGASRRY